MRYYSMSATAWFLLLLLSPACLLSLLHTLEALSHDGQVLANISQAFSYAEFGYFQSWNSSDDTPCEWVGVRCNANLQVQVLDLSNWGMGIVGQPYLIYNRLASLKSLEELDLSSNRLGGTDILWVIANLTALTRLDLSSTSLSQRLPVTIFSNLTNLRYLSLDYSSIQGSLPSLDGLTNLEFLYLSGNGLSGLIPHLSNLTNLVNLDLSNNQLSGPVPSLQGLTDLVSLNLQNNSLTSFADSEFPSLKSLKVLLVADNQLEGRIPALLGRLPSLQTLNLSSNRLVGDIPRGIWSPTRDVVFPTVDMSRNRLNGSLPAEFLSGGAAFTTVNLSHNFLVGKLPEGTFNNSFIHVLDLSHNQLDGPLPAILVEPSLGTFLGLQNNHLSGDIQDLTCFGNTVEVRLQGNMFTGDITGMLDGVCQTTDVLKVLDLRYNHLSTRRASKHPKFPVPNPLQGLLQKFTAMRELLLAGNDLTGTIFLPPSLHAVPSSLSLSLEVLDLSDTNLEGELPPHLFTASTLPSLTSLNLSNNRLFGEVPAAFTGMLNLTYLDVSQNSLSGPLPAHLPRNLWNPAFFSHNLALCGGPLSPCPQKDSHGVGLRLLLTVVAASVFVSVGRLLAWRWSVYSRKHRQDEDLIEALINRDTATLMPLRELQKATNNFSESCQIGVGGFGTVYVGELSDGTAVAVKKSKRAGSPQDKQQFLNEVRILSQLNHRHLVKLLACCLEKKIAVLVFEFVPNGTLLDHLQGNKAGVPALSWRQRLLIAVQTADALAYLHSAANPPIYHRDVKSANILLDEDLNAKVADFGISKLAPLGATHVSTAVIQGTIGYIDPEYYTSFHITDKSDVYSFGIVLLELISAQSAVDFRRGEDDANLRSMAVSLINKGDFHRLLDPVLAEAYNSEAVKESIGSVGRLAIKCLATRARDRPSMKEVWKELQALWLVAPELASDHVGCIQLQMSQCEVQSSHDSSYLLAGSSSSSASIEMASLSLSSVPSHSCLRPHASDCLRSTPLTVQFATR